MSQDTLYTAMAAFENATLIVRSTSELNEALATLSSTTGGTILVDGTTGPYHIEAKNLGADGKDVLITSLDADNQPHIHQIDIANSSAITVNGMRIDSEGFEDRNSWDHDINILSSSNINIINNDMSGNGTEFVTETNGATEGYGAITARDSEDIAISHNTLTDYGFGITYLEVKGLEILSNDISGIQFDGIRGGGIQDAKISSNHLHDFHGSTQIVNHSDMIQVWGRNTVLQNKNIEISDNILSSGDSAPTQGIFIRQEAVLTDGIHVENLSIHDNIIYNSMHEGIGVNGAKNAEIYDNTVIWNQETEALITESSEATSYTPRIIVVNSVNSDIYGNIAAMDASLSETNTVLNYQDASHPNHPSNIFTNYTGKGDLALQDLMIRSDSDLFGKVGAETSSDLTTEIAQLHMDDDGSNTVTAALTQDSLDGRPDSLAFSAEYTLVNGHPIDANSSKVTWIFDDGTTLEGMNVIHTFDAPGEHEVTLDIVTAEGETATITRQFDIHGHDMFDIDFNAGGIDVSNFAALIDIEDDDGQHFVDGRDGRAFELDGNSRFQIDRSNEQLADLHSFTLDLGFKMESGSDEGYLAQMHNVLTLNVTEAGALELNLKTSDGSFDLATEDGAVIADKWADISVEYDGFKDKLEIAVDDQILASTHATGNTLANPTHSMQIGSHWQDSVVGAVDTFKMTIPEHSVQAALTSQPEQIAIVDAPILAFDLSDKLPRAPLTEGDESQTPDDYAQMLDDIATPLQPALPVVETTQASEQEAPEDEASANEEPLLLSEEDDDTFIENLFNFILEAFGLGSDDAPDAPLDLAPYAQHATPDAFTSPMALFDMVPATGLLDDTTDTGGIAGEEDDDPNYGTEWLLNF